MENLLNENYIWKARTQGVGYLDDGTMVVVERGRDAIGGEVTAVVTSVLTTANGRMVFCRPARELDRESVGSPR